MREVLAWLRQHGSATPLEIGVMEEIVERVEGLALSGAVVRVRLKNMGNPRIAAPKRASFDRNEYDRRVRAAQGSGTGSLRNWTVPELQTLERMCREEQTIEEIRERLPHRSHQAIKMQLSRMGIHARHVHRGGGGKNAGSGTLARARALREERLAEGRAAREVA
jgi:hypothetical protein